MTHRRCGITQLELVVASILLGATLLSITKFRQSNLLSGQHTQQASWAQSRLLNARGLIGTWPMDDITVANIEKLPADDSDFLRRSQWLATVDEIEEPIRSKQVSLALRWQVGDVQHTTPGLVFWVKQP